jgi:hypothetical protein
MIYLTLEMSDETYERLRCGIKFGIFGEISLTELEKFGIKVASVQHNCGD